MTAAGGRVAFRGMANVLNNEKKQQILSFCLSPICRSIGRWKRNLVHLFSLPLPSVDAFEELLDNVLQFCVILLSGGQVAQFVDTLLDFDRHSMRLMSMLSDAEQQDQRVQDLLYWAVSRNAFKALQRSILLANISACFCIFRSRCLVHGGTNHEKTRGRIMHSRSVVRLATQSIRARKSAFPTGRSHGSSSGDPGPNYSADFSAIGSQSAGRPA